MKRAARGKAVPLSLGVKVDMQSWVKHCNFHLKWKEEEEEEETTSDRLDTGGISFMLLLQGKGWKKNIWALFGSRSRALHRLVASATLPPADQVREKDKDD